VLVSDRIFLARKFFRLLFFFVAKSTHVPIGML
jgi:hypothetical protein